MENTILETNTSTIRDGRNNHKAKKRKSPISNSDPEDISLQKKSCIEGDLSQSPATDAYALADAEVSLPQIKENDKACSVCTDREAADGKVAGYSNTLGNNDISCASEDRKSDIACQSLKTEAAASTICNQSQDPKENKRKWSRRKKKSMSNAGRTCEANDFSSKEKSHHGGDLSLSAASDTCNQAVVEVSQPQRMEVEKTGSSHLDREAANGIISDHSNNAVNQNIETNPSIICGQSMEPKAKKRKKQRKSKKIIDSISNVDSNCDPDGICSHKGSSFGGDLSLSCAGGTHTQADAEVSQLQLKENGNAGSSHLDRDAAIVIVSDLSNNFVSQNIETIPSTICDQSKEHKAKKRKKKRKSKKNSESISNADSNPDPDGIPSQENFYFGSSSSVDQSHVNSELRNVKLPSLVAKAAGQSSRKLLILDLNGLLADIRSANVEGYKPDKWIANKAVYKRPFCDDFVQFCFETFDVGVWSSRKRSSVECMLRFLMKDKREKLIFSWNQFHCTKTGCKTIENKDKPIFLKELQKLWNKALGRKKSFYNESNTLLLDDSPYKALRNPPYTGIFPNTYECSDIEDNSLGPNGDLRLYLKRLAAAENVQDFVKENPFGQSPITNSHPSWAFYSKILNPKPSKILNPKPSKVRRRKGLRSLPINLEELKGGPITLSQAKETKPTLGEKDLLGQSKKKCRWKRKKSKLGRCKSLVQHSLLPNSLPPS